MSSKAVLSLEKLAKEHYNAVSTDEVYNQKLKNSRAKKLLKEKFNLQGKLSDDASITGGVIKDVTNHL